MVNIRSYETDDELALSDLFNRVHRPYAGVAVRTPEAWLWAVVQRPGVGPDGVVIADNEGVLAGYVAMDRNGTVWEAVIGPGDRRTNVAEELVAALLVRANEDEIGRIVVNVPGDDGDVQSALERAGFVAGPAPRQIATVLDLVGLFEKILSIRPCTDVHEIIRFRFSDTHPWQVPEFTIDTAAGTVSTVAENDPLVGIYASARAMNRFVLEGRDPVRELLAGRIRIRPATKILTALRVLRRLRVTEPWFHPLGDIL